MSFSLLILGNIDESVELICLQLLEQENSVGIISSVFHKYSVNFFEKLAIFQNFNYVIINEQMNLDLITGVENHIIYSFENAARFYDNILLLGVSNKIENRVKQVALDRNMRVFFETESLTKLL
jgi:hypothetical protein